MGVVTQKWWRDREQPYDLPFNGMRTFFINSQPGEWRNDPGSREAFVAFYGATAVAVLDTHGLVPENVDKTWVAGPGNRPAWKDPEPTAPLVPGPNQTIVNTPFGPVIVDKPETTPASEPADLTPITEALARMESKLNLLLLRG